MLYQSSHFSIKSSRILFMLLLLLHAGAIVIAWTLTMPIAVSIIITTGCLVSLWFNLHKHVFRTKDKQAIVKLWPEQDGKWQLQNVKGEIYSGELSGGSVKTNAFVLLNFKIPNKRFKLPVVIWRDALDADSFRRLRVLLNFTF
jgi:hypothetical protein